MMIRVSSVLCILISMIFGCRKEELIYREQSNDYFREIRTDDLHIYENYNEKKMLILKSIYLPKSRKKFTLFFNEYNDEDYVESIHFDYDQFSIIIRYNKNNDIDRITISGSDNKNLIRLRRSITFDSGELVFDNFGLNHEGEMQMTEDFCKKNSNRLCTIDYNSIIQEGLRLKNIPLD